jgi:IS30 family transposase
MAHNRIDVRCRLSIIYYQDYEISQHEKLSEGTEVKAYFTDPRSPWRRGINKNKKGLLRQYLSKGIDLSVFSQKELDATAWASKTMSRKIFRFQCSAELFFLTRLMPTSITASLCTSHLKLARFLLKR